MDYREFFSQFRHLSEKPGIGGKIKILPEDFVVIEDPLPQIFEGRKHAIFLLKKRNWDTMAVIKEIAKRAGISHRDIGFAGTKDRHAVTYQYISVPAGAKEKVESIQIRDVELRFVSYGRFIKLGHLLGNRFRIIIRDVEGSAFDRTKEIIRELREKGGFPNYFGYQRFGERRVVNHLIGKLLLQGEFDEAARLFLGYADGSMEGDEARRNFWETEDVDRALEEFPRFLRYERTLLYTYKKTGSWKKAFLSLPLPIMRIFIHAYQSYLFNLYLSRRIEELPLNEPLVGDIVVQVKGGIPYRDRTYRVTETNLNFVREKVKRGEAMVSGPLFGFAMRRAKGIPGELEEEILEGEGITLDAFKKLPKPMAEPGRRRELLIRPIGLTYGYLPETGMCFRFFLPKGVYATSVLREIMKDH
ncbi:tRNA pseudouridine(13) synthase TruD [Thermococcus gammatolerans]|uniref:Probable tRNA pseudouridine synthase D n=1 Tax=Thermococcus gammatolerans (strain DSM 15229 / JCM 11827 / EJ3) TaxID=593117 RepID=TRUD_THEGJ|nr:tRNA pseudouridine(13) synthase TruD [Thermococcus gammatolerans]C5A1W0.1 RecName: Full=Probable tRNA pseudouridine synthase D; AltName: Full=tRNA pseudouridine(13) synthase; AltName: Full=tRNA pseudouridylate synthase D; AltName: Full=tRNA-uridine isomerase D [Thermococcus gammatolerans EJ3]ACS34379.1 tRNA pseudouridylate synthase D (TruD) [Thermococcus gammatolerans EJ3]